MRAQIESINGKLYSYQKQLSGLSQALDSLRAATERIVVAIEEDRAQLANLAVDFELESGGESSLAAVAPSTVTLDPAVEAPIVASVAIDSYAPIVIEASPAVESAAEGVAAIDTDDIDVGLPASAETIDIVAAAPELVAVLATASDAAEGQQAADELPPINVAIAGAPLDTGLETSLDATAATSETQIEAVSVVTVVDGDVAGTEGTDAKPDLELAAPEIAADATVALAAGATAKAAHNDNATTAIVDSPTDGAKVVDLASHRAAKTSTSSLKRKAMAVVAALLLVATAGAGFHELMQTEIGQRILELSVCDGEMLSANRNCAMLAWLLL